MRYDTGDRRHTDLPVDYLTNAAEVTTPILFMTGDENRVFADSNMVCHKTLEVVAPGRHELAVFSGYGHQDTLMGAHAHEDVFPQLLDFLKRKAA